MMLKKICAAKILASTQFHIRFVHFISAMEEADRIVVTTTSKELYLELHTATGMSYVCVSSFTQGVVCLNLHRVHMFYFISTKKIILSRKSAQKLGVFDLTVLIKSAY